MTLMQWQDSYSVGVPLIDSDHKILVDLINQLFDAKETGQASDVVGSVLNVLLEYTETHFTREERLMARGGYPDLDAHIVEHKALRDKVRAIRTRFLQGERSVVGDDVLEFLKDWLTGHILTRDSSYRPWVEKVELAAGEMLLGFDIDDDEEEDSFA